MFEKVSVGEKTGFFGDPNDIIIPRRSTTGSAGYDFYSPIDFTLRPGETIKIPTGIRCAKLGPAFLMIVPRSGVGFKYGIRLSNSVGIIDADYADSDNEGHIWVKFHYPKTGAEQQDWTVKKGDAICQGIILSYATFASEITPENIRNGGFGSTSK